MTGNCAEKLRYLLEGVQRRADESFIGTGVIVYSRLDGLRHFQMGDRRPKVEDITDQILKASSLMGSNHDGFHFIDSDWNLTHLNQYVSPKIPTDYQFPDEMKGIAGARIATAILCSISSAVICSGVISTNEGIMTFADGRRTP